MIFEKEFPLKNFIFSKKATKIDEIITINLTSTTKRQIDSKDFINTVKILSIFVAFLENNNFTCFVVWENRTGISLVWDLD